MNQIIYTLCFNKDVFSSLITLDWAVLNASHRPYKITPNEMNGHPPIEKTMLGLNSGSQWNPFFG